MAVFLRFQDKDFSTAIFSCLCLAYINYIQALLEGGGTSDSRRYRDEHYLDNIILPAQGTVLIQDL